MKGRFLAIIFAAVLVAVGLFVNAYYRHREPRYQGKSLSRWIQAGKDIQQKLIVAANDIDIDPQTNAAWQTVRFAVRQMRSDSIPILLKWVQGQETSLTRIEIRNSHEHGYELHTRTTFDLGVKADYGFFLLGKDAEPAWPILIQWTRSADPELRLGSVECLVSSEPDKTTLLPILTRLLTDPDERIRGVATDRIEKLYPKNAKESAVQTTAGNPP